ncbi:TPA: DUF333 domain-containing protein [Pseudomonas aeruginosa]|nr:DUF333 domain-containing protein [Pseudomonas aeruginosa]HDQ4723518.1 DUF333 domain-containing protein [Pseudomonas aeruginosa]
MKKILIFGAICFSSMLFSGCDNGGTAKNKEAPIGMANPASVHCIKKGGKSVIEKDKDGGEYGVCHLPDGTQIEEWELFRRDNPGTEK